MAPGDGDSQENGDFFDQNESGQIMDDEEEVEEIMEENDVSHHQQTSASTTDEHSGSEQVDERPIPSAATNLPEFVERLASLLSELSDVDEPQVVSWVLNRLKPLCGLNAHNYLITRALLQRLSAEWRDNLHAGYPLIRILEELDDAFADNSEAQVYAEAVQFADALPQDVVTSIINIQTSGKPSSGDIIKLYRAYHSPDPPPLCYIRTLGVTRAIIADCFGPSRSRNYLDEKLWLLAYASSAAETANRHPADTSSVQATLRGLQNFDSFLSRVTSMALLQDHVATFLRGIDEPIFAIATTIWLSHRLEDNGFYEWGSFITTGDVLPAFVILDEVTIRHPEIRTNVFGIWKSLLERDYSVNPILAIQFRQKFLDHMLLLIKTGFVFPIFEYLMTKAADIDDSLLIYFVNSLLTMIVAPTRHDLVMLISDLVSQISPEALEGQLTIKDFFDHAIALPTSSEEEKARFMDLQSRCLAA